MMKIIAMLVVASVAIATVVSGTEEEGRGEIGVKIGGEDEINQDYPIVCMCQCCYLGECTQLTNATWVVSSCNDCTTTFCRKYVSSSAIRTKTARTFEALQDGVPEVFREGINVDVCEVISVLEAATCKTASCKRTTDVKAECFDRNEPAHKFIIWVFVVVSIFGVVFGFIKNHVPGLQDFNARYFNY